MGAPTNKVNSIVDTLITHGPALRRAGVRVLTVGDVTVELAAPEEPTQAQQSTPVYLDPLSDPETYGSNGRVPGFVKDDFE